MTEEELREKVMAFIPTIDGGGHNIHDKTRGVLADELITLITKEKAGEIFDRCVEAVKDIKTLLPEYGFDVFVNIEDAIEAIEQERKRYE